MKSFLSGIAALLGLSLLCGKSAAADLDAAKGIVGLLSLAQLQRPEACPHLGGGDVPLYEAAQSEHAMGALRVVPSPEYSQEQGCGRVAVVLLGAEPPLESLPMLEASYEAAAAIVLEDRAPWFRIALPRGSAWVELTDAGSYHSASELLVGGLSYLRTQISPVLHTGADATSPTLAVAPASGGDTDVHVDVLEATRVGGRLWFKVQTRRESPCGGEPSREAVVAGWTPFLDGADRPILWFYSRGC